MPGLPTKATGCTCNTEWYLSEAWAQSSHHAWLLAVKEKGLFSCAIGQPLKKCSAHQQAPVSHCTVKHMPACPQQVQADLLWKPLRLSHPHGWRGQPSRHAGCPASSALVQHCSDVKPCTDLPAAGTS